MQDVVVVVVATVVFILPFLCSKLAVVLLSECNMFVDVLYSAATIAPVLLILNVACGGTQHQMRGKVHRRNNSVPIFRHIEF